MSFNRITTGHEVLWLHLGMGWSWVRGDQHQTWLLERCAELTSSLAGDPADPSTYEEELDRASETVSEILKREPNGPYYRATRGIVVTSAEREAVELVTQEAAQYWLLNNYANTEGPNEDIFLGKLAEDGYISGFFIETTTEPIYFDHTAIMALAVDLGDGWSRCDLSLHGGDTAHSGISTKYRFGGPGVIIYMIHASGWTVTPDSRIRRKYH